MSKNLYQKYISEVKNQVSNNDYWQYVEDWKKKTGSGYIPMWPQPIQYGDDNITPVPWKPPEDSAIDKETEKRMKEIYKEFQKRLEKKQLVKIKCSKCGTVIGFVRRRPFENKEEKLLCPMCYKLKKLKE